MQEERPETIDQKLVRALAHPVRVQILEVLSERVASPNILAAELGTGLSHVAYHTRTLERCGCLELVETAQRRGATEHFYKAKPRAFIGDQAWRKVPRAVRDGVTAASLRTFIDKAIAALEAGTIDDRDDTALNWMPIQLDEDGWREVVAIMEETSDRILLAQTESDSRLARAGGRIHAFPAIVALACFESGGSARAAG
jgi:DNA-binding transcriptional ArsR family regulator